MSGFWTPERTALARRLYIEEGFGAGEVAKRIGTTRNTVGGKAFREDWHLQRTEAVKMVHKKNALDAAAKGMRKVRELQAPPLKSKPPKNPLGSKHRHPKPALKLAGDGTVFEQSEAREPLVKTLFTEERGRGLRIIDPGFGGCRWPLSGEGAELRFCCTEVVAGSAYCPHHAKRAYVPTSSAKELARSLRRYAAA